MRALRLMRVESVAREKVEQRGRGAAGSRVAVTTSSKHPALFFLLPPKIYCDGADGSSHISIEGGMFRNNEAKVSGGAISLWGTDVVVAIIGGTFADNTAT